MLYVRYVIPICITLHQIEGQRRRGEQHQSIEGLRAPTTTSVSLDEEQSLRADVQRISKQLNISLRVLCKMWKRLAMQTKQLWIPGGKNHLQLRSFAPVAATFTFSQQTQKRMLTSTSAAKPTPPKHDWNRAVSEAERIVGYPTSFLSLRWLLSDEIANVALHLRKLVGSNHPLLKTAKHLLYNGKNTMQAWGLIVLLISKAAGHAPNIPDMEQDKSAGVLHSQRALAEVTEMIRISHLVHNSLVNLQPSSEAGKDKASYEDMAFGNKIGLLTGDYLLGHSSAELANLRNQEVVELISSAIRDFSESQFIGERDEQNNPLPYKPGSELPKTNGTATTEDIDFDVNDVMIPLNISKAMGIPEKEWECRNILNAGSLLGKACQSALKLAGQSEEMQGQAYLFGKHLSLAWQACLDAEPFQSTTLPMDTTFSLVSAPVLFHLEYDASLYDEIEKGKVSVENIDYAKIHKAILAGPGLEKTKALQRKHTTAAMEVLEKFPPTDARTALENIILAMQDL